LRNPDPIEREADAPQAAAQGASGLGRRVLRGLAALLLIGLMAGGAELLLRFEPRYLPLRVISVEGEVHRLPLSLLQSTVSERLEGGILTQDLGCLKAAVEELAWVHTAAVRRIWPDRLLISVFEHEPVAYWGEDGLVTAAGIVFRPPSGEMPKGLPRLGGSDALAPLVTQRMAAWSPRFERRGLSIEALEVDARGSWKLQTDAGFAVLLGTGQVDERLERFLVAYPHIAEAGLPARVDMRYSNGLAVSWMVPRAEGRGASAEVRPRGTDAGAGRLAARPPGRWAALGAPPCREPAATADACTGDLPERLLVLSLPPS
jgi:cell division protein FtsQ